MVESDKDSTSKLSSHGDDTRVTGSGDDNVFWFVVDKSITSGNHISLDLWLGNFNLFALVLTVRQDTVVVTFLVGGFLGLGQLQGVLWRLDLQLLTQGFSSHVTVLVSVDDWEGVLDPFLLDAVVLWLELQVLGGDVIVWGIGWDTRDDTGTLGGKNGFHRDSDGWLVDTTLRGDLLVGHVLVGTFGGDVVFVTVVKDTVVDLWRHETTRLTVHGFRSQSGSNQVHLLGLVQGFGDGWVCEFGDFNLDTNVFLWGDTFTRGSVVIHTGLAILFRVDGVSFTKLDSTNVFQSLDVPSDKLVVVWVQVRGDHGTSPVDSGTKVVGVSLT
ncbi:hypothetical protein WICPIJ_003817 [Wickerhamomyces pijperi]|uniref:Uncharacterized protein n=1 Tax=Wickerhamomyces pijperi TaxID=599730 RepID=A0A9P8Q6S8_WICPI|nr:hypothetical protein WICPIJ_003817 [Wickerhamomyces pijperi]